MALAYLQSLIFYYKRKMRKRELRREKLIKSGVLKPQDGGSSEDEEDDDDEEESVPRSPKDMKNSPSPGTENSSMVFLQDGSPPSTPGYGGFNEV